MALEKTDVVATPNEKGIYPPEPKVVSASIASALAAFLTAAIANVLQNQDYGTVTGIDSEILETLLLTLISGAITFVGGWIAKHQRRRLPVVPPVVEGGTPLV